MEEIGEIETVPELEPIAVNGEDKNGGKLEQEGEEEERVEDLIEEVEPEEIERDSNLNGDTTAGGGDAIAARDAGDSDQELDELLDESLGEFGKHIPQAKPMQTVTSDPSSSSSGSGPTPSAGTDAFDDIFSEEFAAEAEVQLNEAMEMLASENPELWQQFESFAKSMGVGGGSEGGEGGASQSQTMPTTTSGAASRGGTSVDEGGGGSKPRGGPANLDDQLEETLKRLRETTEQIEGGVGAGLGDMFGQLDLGSEEGEDQLMKMMQGMMSTLLSKEVLYPSLKELCKQYPDWLKDHGSEVSQEDLQRYSKQLEIMNTICSEFERQPEGEQATQESSDKIMQLMQQLQQYGQPPEGLAGDHLQQAGLPPGLLSSAPSSCTLM